MPLLLLFVVFIVVPIVELAVIIQVGQAIGVLPTIGLLLLDSLLGTVLMRTQGRLAWRRFNEALAAGRVPAREVFDGGLVILGGAFLLSPGFVTDAVGVLLLLPPTRAVFRRLLVRGFAGRFLAAATAGAPFARGGVTGASPFGARPSARRPGQPDVYDGTAHEVQDPPKELP